MKYHVYFIFSILKILKYIFTGVKLQLFLVTPDFFHLLTAQHFKTSNAYSVLLMNETIMRVCIFLRTKAIVWYQNHSVLLKIGFHFLHPHSMGYCIAGCKCCVMSPNTYDVTCILTLKLFYNTRIFNQVRNLLHVLGLTCDMFIAKRLSLK